MKKDKINDKGTPKVIVYSPSGKQEYSITDEKAAAWLKLGHITTNAYENKVLASVGAKSAIQYFIWQNEDNLLNAGMDAGVYEPVEVGAASTQEAINVQKEAEDYYNTIKNINLKDNTKTKI